MIDAILTYKDSAAAVITHEPDFDGLLLNFCWKENGRWVNGGQGMADDMEEAVKQLENLLPSLCANIGRIESVSSLPDDEKPFAEFLRGIRQTPEEFLLEMLKNHKLVINGEFHRRKVSWDMLMRLIAILDFPKYAGTVFMELPSWKQAAMDSVMCSVVLDNEAVLNIFREEQPNGWWDKGEFDFICRLWRLNRKLPKEQRVRVVLADYQYLYSNMKAGKKNIETEDRNTHMANIIENHLSNSADARHSLFLVGCMHAYKSAVQGTSSTPGGKVPAKSAGAQLSGRLGKENVFTVYQHHISMDNSGRNRAPLRGGVFDRAFKVNGNRPVGFVLNGSPFGCEPFDGTYELKYDHRIGTYSDNFDGYLFLCPLDYEPQNEPLWGLFSDKFIDEMKRRAEVMGNSKARWLWFGCDAPSLTFEKIREALTE